MRVERVQLELRAQREVLSGASVDQVVRIIAAASGNCERRARARAGLHDEAVQARKLRRAAIQQRHSGDGLIRDHVSDGRAAGLQKRRRSFYGDGLGDFTDIEAQVGGATHAGFDEDIVASLGLKTGMLRRDFVFAGGQERKAVVSFAG